MTSGCEAVEDVAPQALGVTYWFEATSDGEPYTVRIRLVGRRIGVKGKPGRRDGFDVTETVERVVPGSGRVAVTTRISDITAGEWHVTATPLRDPTPRTAPDRKAPTPPPKLPHASSTGTTGFAPIIRVRAPGARPGAWPTLVAFGVAVALTVQGRLSARADLNAARVLLVSLVASLAGLAGAKLYYLVEHRGQRRGLLTAGLCIQGFVLGAISVVAAGAALAGLPVGRVLDATAPGLLFGMTIGRFGCFFGGCCAGRPTASRWGLWSSDRHLGTRRIPTQLLESALALVLGLATLLAVWTAAPDPAGVVFVGGIAAYTFGRQLLFPLRDLPRHTLHGRGLTMTLAGTVIALDLAVALLV